MEMRRLSVLRDMVVRGSYAMANGLSPKQFGAFDQIDSAFVDASCTRLAIAFGSALTLAHMGVTEVAVQVWAFVKDAKLRAPRIKGLLN